MTSSQLACTYVKYMHVWFWRGMTSIVRAFTCFMHMFWAKSFKVIFWTKTRAWNTRLSGNLQITKEYYDYTRSHLKKVKILHTQKSVELRKYGGSTYLSLEGTTLVNTLLSRGHTSCVRKSLHNNKSQWLTKVFSEFQYKWQNASEKGYKTSFW